MTTFVASTTAQLLKFVAGAANGDVIQLKSGTYSGVTINAINKTANVMITSANPDKPAILTDLTVQNSSGLSFTNLEMTVGRNFPIQVNNSNRITLDNLDIHGTLNGSSGDDFQGVIVRGGTNVTISNSSFRELTDGLAHFNTTGSVFSGNSFELMRDNGIAGGGSSQLLISNNTFTNFDHTGWVHPDAIQLWTTNTTKSATDVTITGNVFQRGTGAAVQGIFLGEEVGTLPYKNLTITNNTIIGATFHGIGVNKAINPTISGNVVIGADDQKSWIMLRDVTDAKLTDNIASSYSIAGSTMSAAGNVQAASISLAELAKLTVPVLAAASSQAMALSATAARSLLPANVDIFGFIDGPSPTGKTYTFAETRVDGTAGSDRMTAAAVGASHLYGYDGADALTGSRNGIISTLEGGKGDDLYAVFQAMDVLIEKAGEGNDTVYASVDYTLGANFENVRAQVAGLTLSGNEGGNSLVAAASGSVLYGKGGDDTLQGAAGVDRLFGGDGNDRHVAGDGGAGNDTFVGGAGRDTMIGGDGNDTLEGGSGIDLMTGGKGADAYCFREGDLTAGTSGSTKEIITDFNAGEGDRLWVNFIDANTKVTGDQAFSFIGGQVFHGVAGELRFAMDGDGITVYGDTNGDKMADIELHLTGLTTITSGSFFL